MANENKDKDGRESIGPSSPSIIESRNNLYKTVPKQPLNSKPKGYDDANSANSGSIFNRSKSLAQNINLSKKPQLAKSSFNIKDASAKNSNKKISPFEKRSISTADPK